MPDTVAVTIEVEPAAAAALDALPPAPESGVWSAGRSALPVSSVYST